MLDTVFGNTGYLIDAAFLSIHPRQLREKRSIKLTVNVNLFSTLEINPFYLFYQQDNLFENYFENYDQSIFLFRYLIFLFN